MQEKLQKKLNHFKNMNITTIEEAKKYLNQIIYTATDISSNRGIFKIKPLYIGGVNLFFNQVNYTVEGFYVYKDRKCQNAWGDIKKEDIADKFNTDKYSKPYYFFSKIEAEKYKE